MENRKIGVIFVIISLVFFVFLIYFGNVFYRVTIGENILSFVHVAFGFFGFMLGLGFYLLLFNKTDRSNEEIIKKLEREKDRKIKEEKFDIILRALDEFEGKVLRVVKEQNGITQSTLRFKVDMSKAKLSYVLQELERRGLVKRVKKGKTLQVFLKF